MEKAEILIKDTHTESGIPCQRWHSQNPHKHKFNSPKNFPDANLKFAAAFCRSPNVVGDYAHPWCYTSKPDTRWEDCEVERLRQGTHHILTHTFYVASLINLNVL